MISIAKDAWAYLWKLLLAVFILGLMGFYGAAWVIFAIAIFVAYFFRDPERFVPLDPKKAISPADGKVMTITDIDHDEFIGGPAKKVSIFLNIFNVHINRSPIEGRVAFKEFRAGKMLPAYKSHASEENERNTIGIEGPAGKVKVHQITGLIARRIVCNVDTADELKQGERYGLIKFGSCTEIVLPASVTIMVGEGEIVRGGETIIATFED
jgi:phosphatidylserine decarboxylase